MVTLEVVLGEFAPVEHHLRWYAEKDKGDSNTVNEETRLECVDGTDCPILVCLSGPNPEGEKFDQVRAYAGQAVARQKHGDVTAGQLGVVTVAGCLADTSDKPVQE